MEPHQTMQDMITRMQEMLVDVHKSPCYDAAILGLVRKVGERFSEMSGNGRPQLRVIEGGKR